MAEIIPVEVELVVKSVKGKLNDLRGASKSAANMPASKGETGIMGLLTKALGSLLKIVAVASLIGLILNGLKMSMKLFGKIFDVLSKILRPIDYVLGQMLLVVLRMLMPLVRAINMMFRPFMQQIRDGLKANKESGGGSVGALAVISEVFAKFIAASFSIVLEEAMKGIINIMFAVTEIIMTVISGIAILIVRLLGFNEVADMMGTVMANSIANMDLVRQGLILITEQGFTSFREALMGIEAPLDTGASDVDSFSTALQGLLGGIATGLDTHFGTELSEKLTATNEAAATMKTLFEQNGINAVTLNGALEIMLKRVTLAAEENNRLATNLYQTALKSSTLWMNMNKLKTAINNVSTAIVGGLDSITKSYNKVISIINSYTGGDNNGAREVAPGVAFGDFIARPNGQMIKFDPNDTIMGFKNPNGGLGGALNSGGQNIVINVNGYIGNENQLAKLMGEEMRKQVKLTSTYGKSF